MALDDGSKEHVNADVNWQHDSEEGEERGKRDLERMSEVIASAHPTRRSFLPSLLASNSSWFSPGVEQFLNLCPA